MAGVKSGVSQAPCSAAARVFARFQPVKSAFPGACRPYLQRERNQTAQTRPNPITAPECGRCADTRMAPLRLQGSPCPAHVGIGSRLAPPAGGPRPVYGCPGPRRA